MFCTRFVASGLLAASLPFMGVALGGCASERGMDVPASATLAADAVGTVDYRAPHDGMIYVYDRTNDQLIYSGVVHRGEMFEIDAVNDRMLLDGRVIQDKTPGIAAEHRVFFDTGVATPVELQSDRTGY
jgi:hypothetical protein